MGRSLAARRPAQGPRVTGSHFLPYLPLQLPGQKQAGGRSLPCWRGTGQTRAAPRQLSWEHSPVWGALSCGEVAESRV